MKRPVTPVDAIRVRDRRTLALAEHPRGILANHWRALPRTRIPTCKEDPRRAPG